jgi:hypothetical protein
MGGRILKGKKKIKNKRKRMARIFFLTLKPSLNDQAEKHQPLKQIRNNQCPCV